MKPLVVWIALALVGCMDVQGSQRTPHRVQGVAPNAADACAGTDPTGGVCTPPTDLTDPPISCGTFMEDTCGLRPADGASCPCDTSCMATVEQSGDITNLRMGRIRLWAPASLLVLAPIAFDPAVNARCVRGGSETFNWLIRIDGEAGKVKTGGAAKSADGKSFSFATDKVGAAEIGAACPGFAVSVGAEHDLSPVEVDAEVEAGKLSLPPIPLLNVPIYTSGKPLPIILPLSEVTLKDVTLSPDGNCVGRWQRDLSCGEGLGWTTGGAIVAKITTENADNVPVEPASCQSLCALLANDSTKVERGRCKRDPDGNIPEIGDSCVGGTSCKNAFTFSATFGAYGVSIE